MHSSPRRLTRVTWVALLAPLPYTLSRLLWAGGVDAGLSPAMATELGTPGVMSVYLVFLAALAEAPGILVHTVVAPRRERVPARVPLVGGRRIRPGLVIAPLVLALATMAFAVVHSAPWFASGFELPDTRTGLHQEWWPNWGVWMPAVVFWVWLPALSVVTLAYHRDTGRRRVRAARRARTRTDEPAAVTPS